MKTISMEYNEYKTELDNSHFRGYKAGCLRMIKVLNAIGENDFNEAHCILIEDMESQGHELFLELVKNNGAAKEWLKREGL